MLILGASTVIGSSPRGRGKHGRGGANGGAERLIPAWAGKTTRRARSGNRQRAHPRMGGENLADKMQEACEMGSSPRGRGKRASAKVTTSLSRLIPAQAGKTAHRLRCVRRDPAHPRAGGENTLQGLPWFSSHGSSPCGRGKRLPARLHERMGGLIPARAGENAADVAGDRICGGSSPRGRGKLPQFQPCR